jgi:S1-C subfamily serine protease
MSRKTLISALGALLALSVPLIGQEAPPTAPATPEAGAPPPAAPANPVPAPPGAGALEPAAQESAVRNVVPTVIETSQEGRDSIIRVTSTVQTWSIRQPWEKEPPRSATAIGAILSDNRVLVTGDMVANHNYIEMEDPVSGTKVPATVKVVDYEANLAIVTPDDPAILKDKKPLELGTTAKLGDDLEVWQVQPTGDVMAAHGKITSVELVGYSAGNYFLGYRANLSLQYRYANLTLPIVSEGKLAGMLLRYDSDGQTLDVASGVVIEHFLKEAAKKEYHGFPLSGIEIVNMLDPQLRRYMKLPEGREGVYIQNVVGTRPGAKSGLKAGDIILEIAGQKIDNRGNYAHPVFGRISMAHLIRTEHYVGDIVPFKLWREGAETEVKVTMDHRPSRDYLVPPYIVDQQPRYLIVGGLVMQELSLPYLLAFGGAGGSWTTSAPQNLMYYHENQDSLKDEKRGKIVFIVGMIPTNYTIGYEGLGNSVVAKVNGKHIGKLEDVEEALQSPQKGFHKIEIEKDPYTIYLDDKELPKIDQVLTEMYRIPALSDLHPAKDSI